MSKHKVLLADSSYTIRRIVELSFSEESDIELVTFESGTPLREKLLELTPHVVLVDIRLPEFNGYQVCKFVNETPSLSHTHVFLLKGGFEPVNEELLKELKYQEIITKPFDSNALVKSVKELLEGDRPAASAPAVDMEQEISDSFPDDLPEISGFDEEAADDISFSDIQEEVASDLAAAAPKKSDTGEFMRDDVVPSEEITQGAQPDRDDSLKPDDNAEEMANPFQEDSQNTDIDELLEKEIERERQSHLEEPDLEAPKPDEFRFGDFPADESLPREGADADSDFSIDAEEAAPSPPDIPASATADRDADAHDTLSEAELAQAFAEAPEPRQRDDIFAPHEAAPDAETPPPIPGSEADYETDAPSPVEDVDASFQGEIEENVYTISEDTDAERLLDNPDVPEEKNAAEEPAFFEVETGSETDLIPEATGFPESAPQAEPAAQSRLSDIDPEQLARRMEDKLSIAVKEILWEVVPPLAERIIKDEIRRLESEVESSET